MNGKRMMHGFGMAAVALLFIFMPFGMKHVYAASSIGSLDFSMTIDFPIGETTKSIDVDTSGSNYEFSSSSVNVPSDGWEDGDDPTVTLKFKTDSGYVWSNSFSDGNVSMSFDGNAESASVSSVSGKGTRNLTVKVKVKNLEDSAADTSGDYELTVSDLEWDEDEGRAMWDTGSADDAKKYEVKLYRGNSLLTTVTTTSDSYNFASFFTASGYYKFSVRAVYNSSHKGTRETSDSFHVTSSEASTIKSNYGSSTNNSESSTPSTTGWLQTPSGWRYRTGTTTYVTNQWQQINGLWYYFDSNGYMKTGWVSLNGVWYYLDPTNGNMLTGWRYINGSWYFMDTASGAMHTGWLLLNGTWYYLAPSSGAMVTNWLQINNVWYYFDAVNGNMYANTTTPDNHRVSESGALIS